MTDEPQKPKQVRVRSRKSPPRRVLSPDDPRKSPERIRKLHEGLQRYYERTPKHLRKTRRGSPDGVREKRGRKRLSKEWKVAQDKAKKAVQFFKDDGKLDVDAAGEAILVDFVAVVLAKKEDGAPVFGVNDRLKAGTAALQYLRAKPEAKSTVRVETAEDFFAKAAMAAEEVSAP